MTLPRLSVEPQETCCVLVINTTAYAGEFERELCAFITGATGDCEVGEWEAIQFEKDNPYHERPLVQEYPDAHGDFRPATPATWGTDEPRSAAIFLDPEWAASKPPEFFRKMVDRAHQFLQGRVFKESVTGWGLFSCEVERTWGFQCGGKRE